MFKLRPYQQEALQISKEKYGQGVTRQLLSLPTGMGKTVVFSSLPKYHGIEGRTLVLVHREELATQAADKLRKWNKDFKVEIEMGQLVAGKESDVVVASVQSIGTNGNQRLKKFDPEAFGAVICDEAHHSIASTYLNVFDHFRLVDPDNLSGILLFGVTATSNRGDGQGLGRVYDEVVYQVSILDAIKQGWLADVRGIKIKSATSLDAVRVRAGDFAVNELESAVNNEERNHLIVQSWLKHGEDRQTVAFCVDVAHTQQLAKTFQSYGVPCEPIWGTDPDRAKKLMLHREGKIKVLTNCNILTEGYDDWQISCIIMARPTKSQLLFIQMAGRGTRIPDGVDNIIEWKKAGLHVPKEDCLILDVVDNTSKHSLVTLASVFGIGPRLDMKGQSIVTAQAQFEEVKQAHPDVDFSKLETMDELETYVEMVDLFNVSWPEEVEQHSKLQWHKTNDAEYWINLPTHEQCQIKRNLLDTWDVSGTINKQKVDVHGLHSLQESFRVFENYLNMFGRELRRLLLRKSSWHKHPSTKGQIELIKELAKKWMPELLNRVDFATLSKGEASTLITKLTDKQFSA